MAGGQYRRCHRRELFRRVGYRRGRNGGRQRHPCRVRSEHGELPDTVEQLTGGGGRQILFQPTGSMVNSVKFAPGLDTRSTGGYVVVPPSLHISGRRYEWEISSRPDEVPFAECPGWLVEKIAAAGPSGGKVNRNENGWAAKALEGVSQGERDHTGIKLAGYLFEKRLEAKEVLAILRLWNEKNGPPMPDSQVEKIVRSGSKWEFLNDTENRDYGTIKLNLTGPC